MAAREGFARCIGLQPIDVLLFLSAVGCSLRRLQSPRSCRRHVCLEYALSERALANKNYYTCIFYYNL